MSTKILVVEDEKIIAFDIQKSLESSGYSVPAIVSSGEQVIEKIPEVEPDLVLMDIILKGDLDGVKTAEIVRDRFDIPVVYLTAHADETTLKRAKISDPFGYILKPFEDRELVTTIEIALSRHRAESATRKALQQEKELSELRSRFVSVVSHEFRNPLSTILFSTELLEKYQSRLSEAKRLTYLQRIQAAVKRMSQLLDNVLAIGATDAGKLICNPTPSDLNQFCLDLIEELQFSTNTNCVISFNNHDFPEPFTASTHLPCLDTKLLQHILINLLSNAIKYSPAGSKINFDLYYQPEAAILRIQDHGMGIPVADQAQLFSPFHRGTNVSNIAGTGLGLSIVKQCAESHGGTVQVVSEVGMGTLFTVTLPLSYSLAHSSAPYA
ncbi:response regulator [Trichocoleus sp. FACHB-591]|uniref:hybrid sensor histidine kinase/response regulator n=1 Tax=Trichocoleus sp. FACHB-591 TaxID=2692872 RepID=UPI001685BE8B|nr:ATP-binding protein [Trichocoleus sp. FACHB-591]MBD2094337.1 response regulator [Trichocoleus sp. FACHB-591]